MTDKFRKLFRDLKKEPPTGPDIDRCRCEECGWVGNPNDCEHYTEQESWEMPHIQYEVYICPKCNEPMGCDFWASDESIVAFEKYND